MKYLNTLFILFLAFGLTAQITTGSLTMEITDVSSTMPGSEEMNEMMKGSAMTMHFTPEKQVTLINMNMGGMEMKMRQYFEGKEMIQFMDMMGQKIKFKMDMSNLEALGINSDMMAEAYKVTYDKSDTKMILGYKCYRAETKVDVSKLSGDNELPAGIEDMKMISYITEDIKMNHFNFQQFKGLQFPGTPLMMEMDMGMMTMTYVATDFSKDVDPSLFEYPEGDYQEMDPSMLQNMGGGFGF